MSTAPPRWHERAAALRIDGRAVIDGQRRDAPPRARRSPACPPIDGRLLVRAVARRRGGPMSMPPWPVRVRPSTTGRWAGKPPAVRKKLLQRFAEKILAAPR